MTLKTLLAVAAAAAIAVGLGLPALHGGAEPKSQIEQIDVGRS